MLHLRSDRTVEENLAYLYGSLIVDSSADCKSDSFFEDMYNARLMVYNITSRDRIKYNLLMYGKNPYGDITPTEEFELIYAENLNQIKKFPSEILNNVADQRVLALGFGSKAFKKALGAIVCS